MQADFVPKNQWPGFKFEGKAEVLSFPWLRSNPHGGRFGVAEGENVIPLIESLVVSWLRLASRFSLAPFDSPRVLFDIICFRKQC